MKAPFADVCQYSVFARVAVAYPWPFLCIADMDEEGAKEMGDDASEKGLADERDSDEILACEIRKDDFETV